MTDLSHLRADFPIFRERQVHFLDSAASSQKPEQVLAAMDRFARSSYANVHRGAYTLSLEATGVYEEARSRVAAFIHAGSPDEVILTRGTTTGINQVAFGWGGEHLEPGDGILLTLMEHHANIVPWHMVARRTGARVSFAPLTEDHRLDLDAFHRLVEREPRIVAVTGMSNVLGTVPPLAEVVEAAHAVGAIVVVDGAQLVPHFGVDVQDLGADFLAFSAHKMLGPTGIGVLWGRPNRLEEMEPFEGGGEMISDVRLDGASWAAIPHRFEAGTPPIIEAAGLVAAIDYLEKMGMEAVLDHDRDLTAYALDRLADLDGIGLYGPPGVEERGGVVSFTLGDVHPHDLATILDQGGVAVRAGHHCAKPLLRHLGVPATARASFYVYNDRSDIDALVAGLERAAALFGI